MKKLLLIASILATGTAITAAQANETQSNYEQVSSYTSYVNSYEHKLCTYTTTTISGSTYSTVLVDGNYVTSGYFYTQSILNESEKSKLIFYMVYYGKSSMMIEPSTALTFHSDTNDFSIFAIDTTNLSSGGCFLFNLILDYDLYWTDDLSNLDTNETEPEVEDGPTITTDNATKIVYASENQTLSEVLSGITAYDDVDGDLTSSIIIENDGEFIVGSPGTYTVKISVSDSSENTAYANITVIVVDDHAPVINGTKSYTSSPTSTLNVETIKSTLTAVDFLGTSLTSSIELISDEYSSNATTPSSTPYEIVFSVEDYRGITTEYTVEVKVIDIDAPIFVYDDTFTVYVSKGTTLSYSIYDEILLASYDLNVATTGIKYDDNQVNYNKTGTYTIDFDEYAGDVRVGTGTITVVVTGETEGWLESTWLNVKFWFTDYQNQILTALFVGGSFLVCLVVYFIKKPKNSKRK